MVLLRIFVFSVLLLLMETAHSNDAMSYTELTSRLNELRDTNTTPPRDALVELEQYLALTKQKNWQDLQIKAGTTIVSLLVGLERHDEAQQIVNQYLPLAEQNELKQEVLRFKMAQLQIWDSKAQSEQAQLIRDELASLISTSTDSLLTAQVNMAIGYSLYVNEQYNDALTFYHKAHKLYEQLKSESGLAEILNAIANLHVRLGDGQLAVEYFERALEVIRSLNDEFGESILLYNLASSLSELGLDERAIEQYQQAIKLSQTLHDDLGLAWAETGLADVLLRNDRSEQAQKLFESAYQLFTESGDPRMRFRSLAGLVETHIKLNQFELAAERLLALTAQSEQITNSSSLLTLLRLNAALDAAQGKHNAAYQKQLELIELMKQDHERQKQAGVEQLLAKFDAENKAKQNQLLRQQNELNELKIAKQQNERYIWITTIALAFLIILAIIYALWRQMQSSRRYHRLALRDELTNSPNRRAILQYAEEKFLEAKHTSMELSIAIVDLDLFKKVNDNYGHHTGDEVLIAFATACKASLRKHDRFGRFGGEEFLLVLADTNKQHAMQIFERIRHHMLNSQIEGLPASVHVTFSMGIAEYVTDSDVSLQSLINRADANLYKAKQAGRDTVIA